MDIVSSRKVKRSLPKPSGFTTREKATSSAGKMATSSAGTRATSIALQLKVSSSAGAPALLLT